MLLGFKVEIYIIKKLKKNIIALLKLFEKINFKNGDFNISIERQTLLSIYRILFVYSFIAPSTT